MTKKLKSLIKLSCSVRILVPSTTDVNTPADTTKEEDDALEFLASRFGGATRSDAVGIWPSPEHGPVKEAVTIAESYCTSEELIRQIDSVIDYCIDMKFRMKQEAIALIVNNEMHFV